MDAMICELNEGWRKAIRFQRFIYELKEAMRRSQLASKSWYDYPDLVNVKVSTVTVAMSQDQYEAYRKVMKMLEEFDPGAAQVD